MSSGSYSTDVPAALGSGKSVDLTGASDYVIIDSIAHAAGTDPFDLGTGFTVSCWIKGWPGNWEPFVSKNGEGNGWQLRKNSGNTYVDWTLRGAGGDFNGAIDASVSGWHHIVGTYDGSVKRIYVDGVLDATAHWVGTVTASDDRVVFGARENGNTMGNYSQIMMDDVAIYDEALLPNEIMHLPRADRLNRCRAGPGRTRFSSMVATTWGTTRVEYRSRINSARCIRPSLSGTRWKRMPRVGWSMPMARLRQGLKWMSAGLTARVRATRSIGRREHRLVALAAVPMCMTRP